MKTGSPPRLPCTGLPAAAGAVRSRDGSYKSWGARQGGEHRNCLGCKGVPALPVHVGHAGWMVTVPLLLAATLVQGGELSPLRDPLPVGLGLPCLCALVPALQPHGAGSLAAPLGTALPWPWLSGYNLSAPLAREMPGAWLGLAVAADPAASAAMPFPSPGGAALAGTQPPPSHVLLCPGWGMACRHGSLQGAGGVKGPRAPTGKLVGSSSKCSGV